MNMSTYDQGLIYARATCNTITSLPPLLRLRPRSPIQVKAILSVNKMCGRFPGSVMIRITYPFDKVFLMVVLLAVIEDSFDFELVVVLDGYWGRWRRCWRAVCYGVRVGVWAED